MMDYLHGFLGISAQVQYKIIISLVVLIISWIVKRLISKLIVDRFESYNSRYQWNKYIKYFAGILTLTILISVWIGGIGSLGTYLGLLSAGIAISLKDLFVNFSGWLFLIIRKPFKVGDRIQIEEMIGDVIDIRIFQFSVVEVGNWVDADQSTGRIIHVPNATVFTQKQANYTAGFEYIWDEIPVLLTFESDWKNAKKILATVVEQNTLNLSDKASEQLKQTASQYMIFYNTLTPIVYTTVKDSGVLLTMRYLCNAKQRRMTEQTIWESVLNEFAKYDNIDFAYPTQRFYHNATEGKPGTVPKG
ncbi:MAG: mechanosensitive ion channel [Candidatus Kapabacteria bacterium]|jgi:small-conductance mechanosensitive channel|nr:mechanosensitive ion channel [Candidatus Kapabacteria bacterium]